MASETQRPQFVLDRDMRNDEVQIYDIHNHRIAAVFYRSDQNVVHAAILACSELNRLNEPAPVPPAEREEG